MTKLLTLLFLLPLLTCGQPKESPSKATLTEIYTQAIGDFIKAANKKNNKTFDTLYIGRRTNGQSDDFPNIELPPKVENTQIVLISPEQAEKSKKQKKSRIYINLMGWVDEQKAEFIFVVFSNGFDHQYDYTIKYKFNAKKDAFDLKSLEFKGPPFDK